MVDTQNMQEKLEGMEQRIKAEAPESSAKDEKDKKKMEKFRRKQFKLANQFKEEVVKRFGKVVKSVIIFGSFVRGDFHEKSDIDLLVVIDDTTARFSPEMKDSFDEKLYEIGKKISEDINVQPAWTLTEFWDMARMGHPLLYTIVRDGWALYDTGFFIPTRKLLEAGKIQGTLEAVELFMEGAPKKIQRVEMAKLYMIAEDLYYALLNSSQAVLMYMGIPCPAPKNTIKAVEDHLVKTKILKRAYLTSLKRVVEFRKSVEHKQTKDVTGVELDKFITEAKDYVSQMEGILAALEKDRKEKSIVKNYEVLIKASVAALKKINKLPEDPKDLPQAIDNYLIKAGLVNPTYADVFKQVVTMRKLVADNMTTKIPERDIEMTREYVRRFVRDIGMILEGKTLPEKASKKLGKPVKTRKKTGAKKK